jgi:hypothetical protein
MKTKSKGERLKWMSLNDVKPISLNKVTLTSKKVTPKIQMNPSNSTNFILVP